MAKAKSKGGRPSKYKPTYCNEVIDFLGMGHSVTAFAGHIGVARSTVFKWAEENEEFSDALSIGQAKATAAWERILIRVASEGGGNATAAIFGVKNRAPDDWADKTVSELSGPGGGPIQTEEVMRDAESFAGRIARLSAAKRDAGGDGEPDAGSEGGS